MNSFKNNVFKSRRDDIIEIDADFVVFTYQFFDGSDLDTRTRVVYPNIGMDVQPNYVGYGKLNTFPTSITWSNTVIPTGSIVDWAGDNTGLGYESVLLDIQKLLIAQPATVEITVDLRCEWYGVKGVLPIEIKAVFYKGGAMIKGTPNSFQYTNPTAISTFIYITPSKVVNMKYVDDTGLRGERFATFTYNFINKTGIFNNNDTTTPSI